MLYSGITLGLRDTFITHTGDAVRSEYTASLPKRSALLLVAGMLGLVSANALGSSPDTKCNRSLQLQASLDLPVRALHVAIVDHVVANSLAPSRLDRALHRAPPVTPDNANVAKVDAILRQIFDEQIASADALPDLRELSLPTVRDISGIPLIRDSEVEDQYRPPLVDIADTEPSAVGPQPDSVEDPNISAELPGFDTDAASRFRREMYRTDI